MAKPTSDDIKTLIEQFEQSDWKEVHVKTHNFELYLSENPKSSGPPSAIASQSTSAASQTFDSDDTSPTAVVPVPEASKAILPEGMIAVTAPNLGTFYSAPKPGAPPYVEVGQNVSAETEVCLIEVMKLFTPVKAGVSGVIREICVSDGQMVEYEQLLVVIEPS
jgi:acetyl-CoA carboxylase biotin carboxyl carrier protein